MRHLRILALALLVAPVARSHAQADFTVADASSSGTYAKMLSEIVQHCPSDVLHIVEVKSDGGAPENLDALANNKVRAAFLHSDVYFANAQSDPMTYGSLQVLVALYPEQIHVLALRQSKTSKKGMSFGKQEFNSLADARDFVVGAAGGGVFTAKILSGQGNGGFRVTSYTNGAAVIAALNSGEIAAAIFVGAQPLPNLEKLDKTMYKLIPIGETISGSVSGVYRPATVNYPGLTNGPVKTMAPTAVLLTRKYNTPAMVDAQRTFRRCFEQHLDELKDTGSSNWGAVDLSLRIPNMTYYEIPAAVKR